MGNNNCRNQVWVYGFYFTKFYDCLRFSLFFVKILFIYFRGREGEREGEKHQYVVTSHVPPTGDLAHNPGVCPDWELNL